MFGLKQRSTHEEIINHVKSQEEQRVSLPNRVASIIHNSVKYQSFINEHLEILEEQQNKAFKHQILQNEIKKQKGVGNHEVNKSTPQQFNIAQDDDDGNFETPSRQSSYLTPEPHSESDITGTISSVTEEEERKKQDQLTSVTAKKHISHSIEGKMLEERVAMNKEVTEGSTKKGAYDTKMKEMWRAYNNYELGDNKEFINDIAMIHYRIQHFGDIIEEDKKEERRRINTGIDDLWERYNEFKSARSVLDPNYQTYHQIALDSVLKGKDIASAVQALKNQPQSKSSPSKDIPLGLVSTAKAKGRPKKVVQPETEHPKPAPKPKGRPKKQT